MADNAAKRVDLSQGLDALVGNFVVFQKLPEEAEDVLVHEKTWSLSGAVVLVTHYEDGYLWSTSGPSIGKIVFGVIINKEYNVDIEPDDQMIALENRIALKPDRPVCHGGLATDFFQSVYSMP